MAALSTSAGDSVARQAMYTLDGAGVPQAVAAATPMPTSFTATAPTTILNQASASQAAGNSGTLSVSAVRRLAVDVNLTAFTGGTAPTVQFFVDRLGVDGIWYVAWTGAVLSAAGTSSTSIGPGLTTAMALTSSVRLRWVLGGTVAPTSVTFSASIVGQ